MSYVGKGATVYYKREKARVIEKYQEDGKSLVVLETIEGRRVVPFVSIIWNGKAHIVTPDGYQASQAISAADEAIESIRNQMKKWDIEKPSADPRDRQLMAKHYAFAAIETAATTMEKNDKQLGLIVRGILDRLEDI